MSSIVLRSYWRSSCSWRVRIALALKAVEYEICPVHLVANGGEQHGEGHQKVNPMRELPVLTVDGHHIAQSVAILEYLEEAFPQPSLLPSNLTERAVVRQMVQIINSGIQPLQNLRIMQALGLELGVDKASQVTWSRSRIAFGFNALETLVADHKGTYCHSDQLTMADLCLVPQLYNARRFSVNLDLYPALLTVEQNLLNIDAFRGAHPDAQPDAPAS